MGITRRHDNNGRSGPTVPHVDLLIKKPAVEDIVTWLKDASFLSRSRSIVGIFKVGRPFAVAVDGVSAVLDIESRITQVQSTTTI